LSDKNSSSKLVVDYAKSCWDDELKRFHSIDDKLSKLLRFITGVIVIFSTFLTWLYVHINDFKGFLSFLIIASSLFSLVSLLSALLQAYKGTQLMSFSRPPMNDAVIKLLDKDNEESAKLLVEMYRNVIISHRAEMMPKEKCFDISYKDVILALFMFASSLFLLVIIKGV
jgi:hypothetical protein